MRISNSTIFQQNTSQIDKLMTGLSKSQQEVSSGKRVVTASDDPAAAARLLDIGKMQADGKQYAKNRVAAKGTLGMVDGALGNVSNLLTSTKTLAVQAGNATLDDSQRKILSTQLQTNIDQLRTLANSRDGTGNYLFSGYQTSTAPYAKDPATGIISYQGDQGQPSVEVAQGLQTQTGFPGQSVFGSGDGDVFNNLSALAVQLATPMASYPGGKAKFTLDLRANMGHIDQALTNVTTVQAAVGNNLNQISSLDDAGSALDINYQAMQAETGDVDIVKAISQMTQQQLALQAAQKSFVQVSSLSLFSYM